MGPKASMVLSGLSAGMKGLGQSGLLQKLGGGGGNSLGLPDASSLSSTGVTAKPTGPNFGNLANQLNLNPGTTPTIGGANPMQPQIGTGMPKIGMNQPQSMAKPSFPNFFNQGGS